MALRRCHEADGCSRLYPCTKSMTSAVQPVDNKRLDRQLEAVFQGSAKSQPPGGVIVTSRATSPGYDFISRFFAPAVGVDEDPVTGSAHCTLGPFWGRILGKHEFLAYQASDRGGYLRVRVAGDRVHLSGKAVTVLRGELTV